MYAGIMIKRQVTHVKRNSEGDIMALCHPGEPWSPRSVLDVISDIGSGEFRYFEYDVIGFKIYIEVINGPDFGKFLQSEKGMKSTVISGNCLIVWIAN